MAGRGEIISKVAGGRWQESLKKKAGDRILGFFSRPPSILLTFPATCHLPFYIGAPFNIQLTMRS